MASNFGNVDETNSANASFNALLDEKIGISDPSISVLAKDTSQAVLNELLLLVSHYWLSIAASDCTSSEADVIRR